jgi:hypothetical protein
VAEEVVEQFRPTSGRVMGSAAVLMVVAVVVIGLWPGDQGIAPYVAWGAVFAGVLAWSAMLRPRLWATASHLVMRNMLSTISIPLAAIEQVAVRQVCAVRAGDRRFVSPVVGRSAREIRRGHTPDNAPPLPDVAYADFVEDRIRILAEEARVEAGVGLMSDEQVALASGVRREWAWLEIAALGVTLVGFVVTLVLAL